MYCQSESFFALPLLTDGVDRLSFYSTNRLRRLRILGSALIV
jgi:hypothetical protein